MNYDKEMEQLTRLAEDGYLLVDFNTQPDIHDDIFDVDDGTIRGQIVPPHDGTGNRWFFRFAASASFDRWANSTACQAFFNEFDTMVDYLKESEAFILRQILEELNEDYKETDKLYEELSYGIDGFTRGSIKGALV